MMRNKGFSSILIILLVSALAVVIAVLIYSGNVITTTKNATAPETTQNGLSGGILFLVTYMNPDTDTDAYALLITNKILQDYYRSGLRSTPYTGVGNIEYLTNSKYSDSLDRQKIKDLKMINVDSREIYEVNSFISSDDKQFVYVSLVYGDELKNERKNINEILQVDIQNESVKKIWENDTKISRYEEHRGYAKLERLIGDAHLLISLYQCHDCGPTKPPMSIILNLETNKEKNLGIVGDISLNAANSLLSFQKLQLSSEPCEDEPCYDGKRTVYKPGGKFFTEELP